MIKLLKIFLGLILFGGHDNLIFSYTGYWKFAYIKLDLSYNQNEYVLNLLKTHHPQKKNLENEVVM